MNSDWLDAIRWDDKGLVPVIAQDWKSGEILMQAFINREALQLAVSEKRAIYWSRSRAQLWRKGEESGHVQVLHNVYLDCDNDSLVYKVEQLGGIACHTGRVSCYYQKLDNAGNWLAASEVIKDPADIYKGKPGK